MAHENLKGAWRRHCMFLTSICVLVLLADVSSCAVPQDEPSRELYRIRVLNQKNGAIEVASAGSDEFHRVGSVTAPARTSARGFLASIYAEPGTIAATAVHGIRIKVAGVKNCHLQDTRLISIVPAEFSVIPKGFGGHVSGTSGICTDIPAGEAIFRNLSPFVGNRVFVVRGGRTEPLPHGYVPRVGDRLTIVVMVPRKYPIEIVFENKTRGRVLAVYGDTNTEIATVVRPVKGVGRYDATGYTGIGRVNTNHTGVITISTAPIAPGKKDGSSIETRGGFMIQPSRHALESKETAQVMVVAPASSGAWLEGSPPLFSGYIGLAHDPGSESGSFAVDVRVAGGEWRALPPLVGRQDNALAEFRGGGVVTHVRIRFPELSAEWIASQIASAATAYANRRGHHN